MRVNDALDLICVVNSQVEERHSWFVGRIQCDGAWSFASAETIRQQKANAARFEVSHETGGQDVAEAPTGGIPAWTGPTYG